MEVSSVIEEYLEAIYRLQERYSIARTSDLVGMLKVSPGTVTNTIERLERNLLIIHEPYKGVRLTEKGRKIALSIVRRHRLLERLLVDILGIEWHKVHEIACDLEHWIDKYVAKRIEHILGYPKTCPHGNPIPTEDGEVLEKKSGCLLLSEMGVCGKGVVSRVLEEESALLSYLERIKMKPESTIEVIEKSPLNDLITVRVDGKVQVLSREVASLIVVRKT
ncbi:MAG: metal-dependent transcriptional regulator [Candidatus Bathyarchaeia archaeon]